MKILLKEHIGTIKGAAKKLTNAKRRQFQATVAVDYLNSNSRKAERIFGWGINGQFN